MNWSKVLLAGVLAGIATWIADFIMHGQIMAATYVRLSDVFSQEQASPFSFLAISVCIGIAAAILFAKTRSSWAAGPKGGATYGFFLGLVAFFAPFYSSLVIEGWPYYLSWCQGGISLIGAVIGGTVLGLVYKQA
jgi:hypothetical protein